MVWIYVVIVAILAYIAHQLFLLNKSRKLEHEEVKYQTLMPHLYSSTSSETIKKDMEGFIQQGPQYDMRRNLESVIQNESDSIKKKKMEDKFEQLGIATYNAKKQLEESSATDYEMLYLLDRWYKKHYDNFLDFEQVIEKDDFDDYLVISCFKSLISNR